MHSNRICILIKPNKIWAYIFFHQFSFASNYSNFYIAIEAAFIHSCSVHVIKAENFRWFFTRTRLQTMQMMFNCTVRAQAFNPIRLVCTTLESACVADWLTGGWRKRFHAPMKMFKWDRKETAAVVIVHYINSHAENWECSCSHAVIKENYRLNAGYHAIMTCLGSFVITKHLGFNRTVAYDTET